MSSADRQIPGCVGYEAPSEPTASDRAANVPEARHVRTCCPQCGGRGTEDHNWDVSEPCPGCGGTGRVTGATASDLAETVERAMWNRRANTDGSTSSWYLDGKAALDALVARVDTLTRERDAYWSGMNAQLELREAAEAALVDTRRALGAVGEWLASMEGHVVSGADLSTILPSISRALAAGAELRSPGDKP